MAVYGFDDGNNKREVYTKEEVLSILQQAIDLGRTSDIDASLAPVPNAIKEQNTQSDSMMWVGEYDDFNNLGVNAKIAIPRIDENNNVYFVDDQAAIEALEQELETAHNITELYTQIYELAQRSKAAYDDLVTNYKTPLELMPVGKYYISGDRTSPAELFGGTWERLQDRFLLAAGNIYTAGTTGGEARHKLTVNELPTHAHSMTHTHSIPSLSGSTSWVGDHVHQQYVLANDGLDGSRIDFNEDHASAAYPQCWTGGAGAHDHSITTNPSTTGDSSNSLTGNVGGGAYHNNMPPYLAVYMWKRVA